MQLPAGFGFHHGNGWEDASGAIRFDLCVAADPTLMTVTMRGLMRGRLERESPEHYTHFTLYPDGRAEVEGTGRGGGVSPHRWRADRSPQPLRVHARGVVAWARDVAPAPCRQARPRVRYATQSFDYGPGVIAEEHVFVPRRVPRSEDDGWLVGPFLDYARGQSGVAVFDARHVADGPVALAWLDYPLPLAFHGQFALA